MIDIQKLADLARITITKEEEAAFASDLESIVAFVDQIKASNVSHVSNINDNENVFREDTVAPLSSAYDLVQVAPSHQDGFVKVPKVIE
jgi:aspartyl-tRNA(Asn)/glutamyl-tRNA(Gln) amidotransferase subunit C